MSDMDKRKEKLIEDNEGMVPARYFATGHDKALDDIRIAFADFLVLGTSTQDYVKRMNEIIIRFEQGDLK